jgi:hypothetical protein
MNENFGMEQVVFDLLHGLLNSVKNGIQAVLFDIALSNEDLFLITLSDAFYGCATVCMRPPPPHCGAA